MDRDSPLQAAAAAETRVAMSFACACGAVGVATWDFCAPLAEDVLEVRGSRGVLRVPDLMNGDTIELTTVSETGQLGLVERFIDPPPATVQRPFVGTVVDALQSGESTRCASTAASALRTAAYIDAVLSDYYGGRADAFWSRPDTWRAAAQAGGSDECSAPPAKRAKTLVGEARTMVDEGAFTEWLQAVLVARGFSQPEAADAARWAADTASYEVETHGARKLLSLLDHEFARSGSCVPQAEPEVLCSKPSMEVWDGHKKLGPALSRAAQARAVEMAVGQGVGLVLVRNCNHFGWGPAYALEQTTQSEGLLVGNLTQGAIPIVTPLGGSTPTVGSNAVAVAMSTGDADCPFFLWDTGTAAMSWGEVQKLRLEGGQLRPGCCVDATGKPTEQVSAAGEEQSDGHDTDHMLAMARRS
jgi:hypothetical protein